MKKERSVKYGAVSIGEKRTVTIAMEGSKVFYVFSGRYLWKDYKYWTGRISRKKADLSRQGLETSRRLERLYRMRWSRLKHAQEALAKKVVGILLEGRVTHLVVGCPWDCMGCMDFRRNAQKTHDFSNFLDLIRILEKHCERRGIVFERVDESGTSEVCHVCKQAVRRPVRSEVICPVHGRTHAGVNAALNILGRYTPVGLGGNLVWITHEWNKHLWVPRTESMEYVAQVFQTVRGAGHV